MKDIGIWIGRTGTIAISEFSDWLHVRVSGVTYNSVMLTDLSKNQIIMVGQDVVEAFIPDVADANIAEETIDSANGKLERMIFTGDGFVEFVDVNPAVHDTHVRGALSGVRRADFDRLDSLDSNVNMLNYELTKDSAADLLRLNLK
ncbi:MAG: hypothetical protein IKE32_03180 [Aeriscardovia sp.]|nr:hypothetical protein [Aeriscardovia sp.]